MQYVHHVPLGVRHDLMEARSQLDMRSRGNIIRTPWASHWTHLADAGLLVDDHPLMVAYSLSRRRVAFAYTYIYAYVVFGRGMCLSDYG